MTAAAQSTGAVPALATVYDVLKHPLYAGRTVKGSTRTIPRKSGNDPPKSIFRPTSGRF